MQRKLEAGKRIGPYEIISRIASGGMGDVYRACDTRIGRSVAIKLLRARSLKHLETEARAVGALSHPNICTLHDVGPNYLVMEHIEGTPVRGPIEPALAIEYG